MQELSELLGTRDLNLGTETRNISVQDTCDFEYDVSIIRVRGLTRWPTEMV